MTGKTSFVCIHGHFYQPPRENPWLDTVPCEPSAAPYHDWNRRITRECYGPNACARIPGPEGGIRSLVSNYGHMSFNFGPTLLTWLSRHDPWVYQRVLEADQASMDRYGGHGNAIAQVYNHIIMPLASTRDKRTQIVWGIRDFRHRFGRFPEGMWLAETAVDNETLTIMAEEGIRFTILSPGQAAAVRPLAAGATRAWKAVDPGLLDTSRPYRVFPAGRKGPFIDVFFYDGRVSRAVAYESLLTSGAQFLSRIGEALENGLEGPRLVSVATDGESYGHHFKFGDMALAWLFKTLEDASDPSAVNFGAFLDRFPPDREVRVRESTAWSCAHGVERWRSDCGCSVAGTPGWNQAWRAPLRLGLDRLASSLGEIFEAAGEDVFFHPWGARDDYVRLLLDPSTETRLGFLDQHVQGGAGGSQAADALRLLESQRMSLYMFTSCGWFFDDISGLESVQILMYAARAIDLVSGWTRQDLEARLKEDLSAAESNRPGEGTGADVYERRVVPARLTPQRMAAHVVCSGVPASPAGPSETLARVTGGLEITGTAGTVSGTVRVVEPYTRIPHLFRFVRTGPGCEITPLEEAPGGPPPEGPAGALRFSYRDLVPAVLHEMAAAAASNIESQIEPVLDRSAPGLMELIRLVGAEAEPCLPPECRRMSALAVSLEIRKAVAAVLSGEGPGAGRLPRTARIAAGWEASIDGRCVAAEAQRGLSRQMEVLARSPDVRVLAGILEILETVEALDLPVDLWETQNLYYFIRKRPGYPEQLSAGAALLFDDLGRRLGFR